MATIKEQIRAEIERRRLHFNKEAKKYQALNNGYSQNCYGARDALRNLENFLDSLPEQVNGPSRDQVGTKFAVEGLEEEISRTYHDGSVTDTDDMDHIAYENIARHFAEWGAEHLKR